MDRIWFILGLMIVVVLSLAFHRVHEWTVMWLEYRDTKANIEDADWDVRIGGKTMDKSEFEDPENPNNYTMKVDYNEGD